MDYLLYTSRLTTAMGYEALKDLLEISQRNNARDGVTGFLHIEGPVVLQYLEGAPDQVQRTLNRIRHDSRHESIEILTDGKVNDRFFEGWKMALVENTTFSLVDLMDAPDAAVADVSKINPTDLITLLSANDSYLRMQPSMLAS